MLMGAAALATPATTSSAPIAMVHTRACRTPAFQRSTKSPT